MPNTDLDESEGGLNELPDDDQDYRTASEYSHPSSDDKSTLSEDSKTPEDYRTDDAPEAEENEFTARSPKDHAGNDAPEAPPEAPEQLPMANDGETPKSHGVQPCVDKTPEFLTARTDSQDKCELPAANPPESPTPAEYSPKEELECEPNEAADPEGDPVTPEWEGVIVEHPEELDQDSEILTRESGLDNEAEESTPETLQETTPESCLSDQPKSDRQSEGAPDGASEAGPDHEHAKPKHRKKHMSATRSIESFFHKSALGRHSKSKSKSSSTAASSPPTKDNVVVTTTSSGAPRRRDKNPCWTNYEIPSKPGRKGPTLAVFYDTMRLPKGAQRTESGKDQKCIILQTPDSLERYLHPFHVASNYYVNPNYIKYYNTNLTKEDCVMNNYYYVNMMSQRKSLLPYYVTKTAFGNVPGMGRVVVCGTQCGKIIFYSFATLDELLVLDTRAVYDKYLSRDNSIDPESGLDICEAIDSTLFEVNCLVLMTTFQSYSSLLAIGNHLGHLMVYDIPSLRLLRLIYSSRAARAASDTAGTQSIQTSSSAPPTTSFRAASEELEESEDDLIDEVELMNIRRHKKVAKPGQADDRAGGADVVFITCLGFCAATGDLWVGYGDGNFAIYSSRFRLRRFYNPNHMNEAGATIMVDGPDVYSVSNFEFCQHEQIVLVVYGNVKVDIYSFEGAFLSTISATRLTNSSVPISSVHVATNAAGVSILYIGLMDGSLLVKQIVYTTASGSRGQAERAEEQEPLDALLSNTIEFVLLYNLHYKFDAEVNFGAPVTSICPVPEQKLVLLGNASGGLSVIANVPT